MILSEKEVQVTSVSRPSMCPAACLVGAGYDEVLLLGGEEAGEGIFGSIGKGMLFFPFYSLERKSCEIIHYRVDLGLGR